MNRNIEISYHMINTDKFQDVLTSELETKGLLDDIGYAESRQYTPQSVGFIMLGNLYAQAEAITNELVLDTYGNIMEYLNENNVYIDYQGEFEIIVQGVPTFDEFGGDSEVWLDLVQWFVVDLNNKTTKVVAGGKIDG